jgi:D-alanine-D-alanine ligase
MQQAQATSIAAYQTLETRGMARVDMFLTASGRIYVNEINTIPGFTSISMYPKLWAASGISYTTLISRLIDLALEEQRAKSELITTGY